MLFNSVLYLYFLTVAVFGSWLLVRWQYARFTFLAAFSCLFYAAACVTMGISPKFLLLILSSTCWDYCVARLLERTPDAAKIRRRVLLLASVGMNLTLLCYFKYLNFFLQNFAAAAQGVGLDVVIPVFKIILPVGISFYTFQTMSYCIDVYRREIPAERNFLRFLVFSTFFPQLVAGPIVRAHKLLPQLRAGPQLSADQVSDAVFRITRGLAKKVVVADYLAVNLVDRVFSHPHVYTSAETWVALYAYTMQIYCDFSGYTDVAIGSAQLLGYQLPENFHRPYQARSVAEFWRRWHMTLSTWLRHYVFFPLGGSRGPVWKAHRNTIITLVLIGLWHGANWTFVLYGLIHGIAIAVNRTLHRRQKPEFHASLRGWSVVWRIALTFHFVVLARVLFRAPSLHGAGEVWNALWTQGWGLANISRGTWLILLASYTWHWLPVAWPERLRLRFGALPGYVQGLALACVAVGLAAVAETAVVPFIYFQF